MQWFDKITANTVILTPNRRLAAVFLKDFHNEQIKNQKICWESVGVFPINIWLQRLWQEVTAKQIKKFPRLLSSSQEAIIWELLIKNSPESEILLQISETAELALSAWNIINQWNVNLDHQDLSITEDGKVFQHWALQFNKLCTDKDWLSLCQLPDRLSVELQKEIIQLPSQIILIGFTEFSPQYQKFFQLCEHLGTSILKHETPYLNEKIYHIGLTDELTEIYTLARWAKKTYDNTSEKKPQLIGCVIQNLEQIRDKVQQAFSEVFSTDNKLILDSRVLPFNISAGKILTSYPIIHTGFFALRSPDEPISINEISYLLRTPYLGGAEQEYLKRSELDIQLKNSNNLNLSYRELVELTDSCPILTKHINSYIAQCNSLLNKLLPSQWAKEISNLLILLGWPGERSLNSIEYQTIQRWLELLREYATFDSFIGLQNFSQAKKYLNKLAASTSFQYQTPEAPIQVLGILEAAGLPFEHLWVMGMEDTKWPSSPKPNPFIPQRMQRILQMPHANAERELYYCDSIFSQFKQNAKNIILSYPLKNDTGNLRPSLFLENTTSLTLADLMLNDFLTPKQKIYQEKLLEPFSDEYGPSFSLSEKLFGGAQMLKLQALCPFKAFSELRLHAKKYEIPQLGIKSKDKGILIHKALELIWSEIKDAATLKCLSSVELNKMIEKNVMQAATLILGIQKIKKRYHTLELQRLINLLTEWMKKEAQRSDFKVLHLEHEKSYKLNQFTIHLRVDRIDEINGKKFIIDYKTGKNNNIKDWFGVRPSEPQLPLYCISEDSDAIGIAFAQIHTELTDFKGVSDKDVGIKSVKPISDISFENLKEWQTQISEWKVSLENLSQNFALGQASINPKEEQTCRQCHLKLLCRIHERDI